MTATTVRSIGTARSTTGTAGPLSSIGQAPTAALPRQRRSRGEEDLPLGSLTQREHRAAGTCAACGSTRQTRLTMHLNDGGSIDFVSCHHCEHRQWEEAGTLVPVADVLSRTARR